MALYQNPELHLTYSYPSTFTDASATIGPAMQATLNGTPGASADLARCVTLPFAVSNNKAGLHLVLLVRIDASCSKKPLKASELAQLTEGEVRGLSASGARTQFSDPISFTTAGHAAEMIRGTFTLPTGQPLHTLVACVLLKPDAACWQFLASTDQALNEMSSYPASLDGGAPQPVVPPNLLPKP